jgi:hypothetical protein
MRSRTLAVLCLMPSLAFAQAAPGSDLLGPASPNFKGPPTTYRSAFGPPPAEPEATPWRAANDEAARLGGHVGQLQDSGGPTGPQGHDMHGAADAAPSPRKNSHEHK